MKSLLVLTCLVAVCFVAAEAAALDKRGLEELIRAVVSSLFPEIVIKLICTIIHGHMTPVIALWYMALLPHRPADTWPQNKWPKTPSY